MPEIGEFSMGIRSAAENDSRPAKPQKVLNLNHVLLMGRSFTKSLKSITGEKIGVVTIHNPWPLY